MCASECVRRELFAMHDGSRLERSLEQLGRVTVLPDGRKPTHATLLDLPSKPFWRADEVSPGVEALLADLRSCRPALLEEALALKERAVRKELESNKGRWSCLAVAENGDMKLEAADLPVLHALLERHSATVLTRWLFSSCLLSYLEAGGRLAAHYGPSNVRLRLQFPLSGVAECRLVCGGEESRYEEGYAIIDDSYLHWAENGAQDACRMVLVVDVWHPGVTEEERTQLALLMQSSGL